MSTCVLPLVAAAVLHVHCRVDYWEITGAYNMSLVHRCKEIKWFYTCSYLVTDVYTCILTCSILCGLYMCVWHMYTHVLCITVIG